MSILRRLVNGVRGERLSRDIEREMSFHLSETQDALVAKGLSPEAARREARRRFGNDVRLRERTREADLLIWLETLRGDVRYAWRSLRRAPVFTLVAVASLGLGIGANTAIFTLMNALMLRTLPVEAPEELVRVTLGDEAVIATNPMWEAFRDRQRGFESVMAYGSWQFNLAERGERRPVLGGFVSGDYFRTLGVRPHAGRLLVATDDVRGCGGAAVISYSLWQGEFGGRDIQGAVIPLNGQRFPVVGVAPPEFAGMNVGSAMQVWVPLCAEPLVNGASSMLDGRSRWWITIVGRPRDGTSQEQLRAHLAGMSGEVMAATVPEHYGADGRATYLNNTFDIAPAATGFSSLRDTYGRALMILMAIVGVVLLVACANVANLLLARAAARQREMAVRMSIGAGRGRLIRQLLTESLLLAALGAAVGVLLARWGTQALVALLPAVSVPVSLDVSADVRVLLFTIMVTSVTGVLFGMVPAWRAARVEVGTVMKASSRSIIEGGRRMTLGKALVCGQLALSLVLVMSAALLLRSFHAISTEDAGFRRSGVLLVEVDIGDEAAGEGAQRAVFTQVLERARNLPGVDAAAIADIVPVSGSGWNESVRVDGFTPRDDDDALTWMNQVSDGYFDTFRTPIVRGRDFNAADVPGTAPVAIVNEAFAQHYFGTTAVVGRAFRTEVSETELSEPYQIVGVVENTRYFSLTEDWHRVAYLPFNQNAEPYQQQTLVLSSAAPHDLTRSVTRLVEEVTPPATLRFAAFDDQLSQSIGRERMMALLSGFFGALGLLLATIGLYGIMAYSVARRRGELGIRLALGSSQGAVMRMVLKEVALLVVVGSAAGLVGIAAGTRVLESMLHGVSRLDPLLAGGSLALLALVALLAGALPAWRAARTDPLPVLRED